MVGDLSHLTGACGTHNCGCTRTNATAGPPLAPRLPPQGICQSACVHQTASSELSFLIPFAQLQPAPLILFEPLGSSHVYVVNPLLHIVETVLFVSQLNQQRCTLPPPCIVPYSLANNHFPGPQTYHPHLTASEEDKSAALGNIFASNIYCQLTG